MDESLVLDLNKRKPLNLTKAQSVNLTKSNIPLTNIRLSAGWDFVPGHSQDLDLVAYLSSQEKIVNTISYSNKSDMGIYLDEDNLTGEGDGDDENIRINFSQLSPNIDKITLAVVIFLPLFGANFSKVRNAYVRLVDESQGERELLRFNLTESGGKHTAILFAELLKVNNEWIFKAIGRGEKASIKKLKNLI